VAERVLRLLTENWALKLAAIALAIMLWMAVRAGTPKAQVFRNVAVQVDLRDPDWRLASQPDPPSVHVTVQGSTGELMTLAQQGPRIVLPVERVADSVETRVVPFQWVQLPAGVRQARVVALRPDSILLRYERLVTRTFPVRARTVGDLPPDYELLLPISTSPSAVQVRGAVRHLAALDSVPLVPVDIAELRSTTNIPARVDTTALGPVRVFPQEVNVVLRVAPIELNDAADPGEDAPTGTSPDRRPDASF
jgi:YbbR domain-containing protein